MSDRFLNFQGAVNHFGIVDADFDSFVDVLRDAHLPRHHGKDARAARDLRSDAHLHFRSRLIFKIN